MYIQVREEGDLLEIIIDRPERRNALDGEGWSELGRAVRTECARGGLRAVLLRSTGSVFCGGADIGWLAQAPPSELTVVDETLAAMRACPHPVVCRVQGPTFGGGIGLVAASDVVVVDPAATFTLSEVRLGIAPALISSYVIERVGMARFRTWAMLGMTTDVPAAHQAGLVDLVAPSGGVDVAVAEVVEAIRRGEPEALSSVKRMPSGGLRGADAASLLAALRVRPAFAEGVSALKAGRLATWATTSGGTG